MAGEVLFLCSLISALKTCGSLALENLALRQQLAVLRRSVKRPRLSDVDRGFRVLLRRIWTDWDSCGPQKVGPSIEWGEHAAFLKR